MYYSSDSGINSFLLQYLSSKKHIESVNNSHKKILLNAAFCFASESHNGRYIYVCLNQYLQVLVFIGILAIGLTNSVKLLLNVCMSGLCIINI